MDLEYYDRRRRISVLRAQAAATPCARVAHDALAKAYARLIDAERDKAAA